MMIQSLLQDTSRNNDQGFIVWLRKVDSLLINKTGMSHEDLPDYCYRDAFDRGEAPSQVATKAIRAARDY